MAIFILIGFILIGILIGLGYYYHCILVFNKNKSNIWFDINNNLDNEDWMSRHDEITALKDKADVKWYGVGIGDYEKLKAIAKIKELYRNVIVGEIFPSIFKVLSNNLVDFDEKDFDNTTSDYFEAKAEKVDKYEKKNKELIKKIFKTTNKKLYDKFIYDFDFTCRVESKQVGIIRFVNYKVNYREDVESKDTYLNAFIGYLINIYDFYDLDKLKDIDKKDYCYDEKTKVLSILISDQITNKVMRKDLYTYFPEDYKKLENGDNIYFSRYKKFYEELNKFICRFV